MMKLFLIAALAAVCSSLPPWEYHYGSAVGYHGGNGQGNATDGNGQGSSTVGNGQGSSTVGNGQGSSTEANGQGSSTVGNGQGSPTVGNGQGGSTVGNGQGSSTEANGQGSSTEANGQGNPTVGNGQENSTDGNGQYSGYGGPFIPILVDNREGSNDGHYSFDFKTGNGIVRHESGWPSTGKYGSVAQQGNWSFTFPDGTPAEFSFVADEGGYRVESPLLPVPPPYPQHAQDQIDKAEIERAQGIEHNGSYTGH